MTVYTYAELTAPTTKEDRLAALLALAAEEQLPLTAWDSGSFPRVMFEIDAAAEEDFSQLIAAIAKGGILEDASGKWLTILAKSFYGLERRQPISTQGTFQLSCAANAGPHAIQAGKLWATDGSRLYFNTTAGTLVAGGILAVDWQAEKAGTGYTIDENASLRLLTPLVGVTVTNPPRSVSPYLPWWTRAGTNEETDLQLKRRCRDKWPAMGTGATTDAYHLWALSVTDVVTRATVQPATPSGGHVTIVIAGGGGLVDSSVVSSVAAYMNGKRPVCVTTHVVSATNLAINLDGTAIVKAGYGPNLEGNVRAAVDRFLQDVEIGEPVYLSAILEQAMGVDGVVDIKLTTPVADIVPAATEVPIIGSVHLSYSEVA